MRIEAAQFVFDSEMAEEDQKVMQAEINQAVANGFVMLAAVPLGTKIYYQLARQLQPDMVPPGLMEKLKKGSKS